MTILKTLTAAAFAGLVAFAAAPAMAGTVTGPARTIDGDTLVVDGINVRLKGIDAPELGTDDGEQAMREMRDMAIGTVTCTLTGEKTYNREVGYCTTEGPTSTLDLNREIIARGVAMACPRYSTRYMADEVADLPRSSYCIAKSKAAAAPVKTTLAAPKASAQVAPVKTASVRFKNCTEAKAAGYSDIPRGHLVFQKKFDRDNDGIGCESSNR